jgi:hypothetical protein
MHVPASRPIPEVRVALMELCRGLARMSVGDRAIQIPVHASLEAAIIREPD